MNEIAPHRIGKPSPLAFHLSAAAFGYAQAVQLAPLASGDDFPWHPDLSPVELADISNKLVLTEALARMQDMLEGIEKWQRHPFRRPEPDLRVLWSEGATRLIDYGGNGPPVLVLPSLINRSYILDILPERSMLGYLKSAGLHPYLLDWGTPSDAEQSFGLDTYTSRRLLPAISAVSVHSGRAPVLLGYCMGGTLAAGVTSQSPQIAGLVTIGAPWHFASSSGVAAQARLACSALGYMRIEEALSHMVEVFGFIPVDVLQGLFAMINPIQAARKFRRFAKMDPQSDAARIFVAFEDWLADGVPLAGPLAQDVLVNWQLRDSIASGKWKLLGQAVDPRQINCPVLVVTGAKDRIAAPEQARPLARAIQGADNLHVGMGHVSMVAGSQAQKTVWQPIVEFITTNN